MTTSFCTKSYLLIYHHTISTSRSQIKNHITYKDGPWTLREGDYRGEKTSLQSPINNLFEATMTSRAALALLALLWSLAIAARLTVDTGCNTYTGLVNEEDGVVRWLGIRYAAPPVGDLRFAPPRDPSCADGVQLANEHGKLCLATNGDPSDTRTSEDCLFLDVYTPANATTSTSNTTNQEPLLPVFVFIQGGGFNSLSNPNLDGTGLIKASGHSMVFVTFNYRVGPFGFLTNANTDDAYTEDDKVTPNNGLRDQRKALRWVQKYIRFFGGDPGHVVLGGDSAGAASISLQMVAYGGDSRMTGGETATDTATDTNTTESANAKLFHAAAAESVSFATVLTVEESQYLYDNFSLAAGCSGGYPTSEDSDSSSSSSSSLACLRSKTARELQAINTGYPYPNAPAGHKPIYPWNPVIDGDMLQDVTYRLFAEGKFPKIPMIVGDDTNEGTTFAPQSASTQEDSDLFLRSQFPYLTTEQLGRIAELYPNEENASCSSNTTYGGGGGGAGTGVGAATGCFWHQAAAVYGDMRYTCPGLYISSALRTHGVDSSWSYRWNVEDPMQISQGLGVPHTVELNAIFGPEYVSSNNAPASYQPGGVNAAVVPLIQAYWTSFIRSVDPNTYRLPGSAVWDVWDPDVMDRLLFSTGGGTQMETVDERMRERCAYFYEIGVDLRQ
ncbi:vacuolar triacylglycerol lipase [Xylariaceae sp. FL0594]|nr:vacuolar triacylglycerol lipase [Xylariaceae sp. FL0594]